MIDIEVYQQDWIPGFAAFRDDGSIEATAKAHVVLNLGSFLSAVEAGAMKRKELPYAIAESIMHEVIHALEAWAGVAFSEERVEQLLAAYRKKYGMECEEITGTHGQHSPGLLRLKLEELASGERQIVTLRVNPRRMDTVQKRAHFKAHKLGIAIKTKRSGSSLVIEKVPSAKAVRP
jgi:hypothetical protein